MRKSTLTRKQRKAAKRRILAVYLVDRAYGGHEEGGWYYDCGTLVRVVATYFNAERGYAARETLQDELDIAVNQGRRPISSVLSEGRYDAILAREHAAPHFPTHRPRYS
jgi:hypothetical protein